MTSSDFIIEFFFFLRGTFSTVMIFEHKEEFSSSVFVLLKEIFFVLGGLTCNEIALSHFLCKLKKSGFSKLCCGKI